MARSVLAAIVLLCVPVAVQAQGLGDAAARERQKRKTTTGKETRVYDNDDLRAQQPAKKDGDKSKAAEEPEAAAAVSSPEPTYEGSAAERTDRVDNAQKALNAAEANLGRLEARIKELQDKLNPMSPSFVYGPSAGMSAPGADLQVREELRRTEGELPEARSAVDSARKALDDARSGRAPSGAR